MPEFILLNLIKCKYIKHNSPFSAYRIYFAELQSLRIICHTYIVLNVLFFASVVRANALVDFSSRR